MKFLLIIIAFIVPSYLNAQDINTRYKIYDVKKQQVISIDNIVSDMKNADVLFFGEEHNDSIGHYLEAEIFKKLNEKYAKRTSLTMEMFHTDVQPVLNEGRYNDKFAETLGGHSMGPMKIYQTQNLWDATMAWSIAKFLKENKGFKILQLNGRFHSDEKLGTAAKLQKYAPKARILNISSFSDAGFNDPNWNKFSNLGDYIIITDPEVKRSF